MDVRHREAAVNYNQLFFPTKINELRSSKHHSDAHRLEQTTKGRLPENRTEGTYCKHSLGISKLVRATNLLSCKLCVRYTNKYNIYNIFYSDHTYTYFVQTKRSIIFCPITVHRSRPAPSRSPTRPPRNCGRSLGPVPPTIKLSAPSHPFKGTVYSFFQFLLASNCR